MKDFKLSRFKTYSGANYYLDEQAVVFDLDMSDKIPDIDHFLVEISKKFPAIKEKTINDIPTLLAETIIHIQLLDMNLFSKKYNVIEREGYWTIAIQYLDDKITEDAIYFAVDWLHDIMDRVEFPFEKKFEKLAKDFDRTLFGGPTLYHILEAAYLQNIPLFYIYNENVFQMGYGKYQRRGRSTTIHTDSIKDTEFTMNKDMVKDFLFDFNFPSPKGQLCFDAEEVVEQAEQLGYPVVVKPLAGHKGQGVHTNLMSASEVRNAFDLLASQVPEGKEWDGALIEKQVNGTDHRLLTVGGKFVAALERVPAYVEGDGRHTIGELIEIENDTIERLDNARSPLCKIKVDNDLINFIAAQDLDLNSTPKEGERITLRRVANISAGGVSINVTDKIHPTNVKLAEDIGKYLCVTCLGIDLLAEDISKPWTESPTAIIEINAGPGVFMHLAPAIGGSVNVPSKIIDHWFEDTPSGKIPIIAANRLSKNLAEKLSKIASDAGYEEVACHTQEEGLFVNSEFLCKNEDYCKNIKNALRNPKLDFAIFEATSSSILDYGLFFKGSNIVILDDPDNTEEILTRDLVPEGVLIETGPRNKEIVVTRNGKELKKQAWENEEDLENKIAALVKKYLPRQ
ncbi:MAG: acetate--CoA ligase family protein [Candidatus Coatesbacteria bacterium]|nr:acetate--CoA ligase family protein [Candidatus Coatesbacteria bacterium]